MSNNNTKKPFDKQKWLANKIKKMVNMINKHSENINQNVMNSSVKIDYKENGEIFHCAKDYLIYLMYDCYDKKEIITLESFKKRAEEWLIQFTPSTSESQTISCNKKCEVNDYNNFILEISKNVKEFIIYREMYDVIFQNGKELSAGDYNFYSKHFDFAKHFKEEYNLHTTGVFKLHKESPIMSVKIKAFDEKSAESLSRAKFSLLEKIINLSNNLQINPNIQILEIRNPCESNFIVSKEVGNSHTSNDSLSFCDLEELLNEKFIKELLILSTKENKTDIEKRIIRSAEWIGTGKIMGYSPIGFVCYISAMDAFLSQGGENAKRVSECVASVLPDFWFEGLCDLKKIVENLYYVRNNIVHGSEYTLTKDYYKNALRISNTLVRYMFSGKEFSSMTTITELEEYTKKFNLNPNKTL